MYSFAYSLSCNCIAPLLPSLLGVHCSVFDTCPLSPCLCECATGPWVDNALAVPVLVPAYSRVTEWGNRERKSIKITSLAVGWEGPLVGQAINIKVQNGVLSWGQQSQLCSACHLEKEAQEEAPKPEGHGEWKWEASGWHLEHQILESLAECGPRV